MTSRACRASILLLLLVPVCAAANVFDLGAELLVQGASGPIQVPGYSVPSFADWNGDTLPDLIIGTGSGTVQGRIQVHLNTGHASFNFFVVDPIHAQTTAGELTYAGSG